MARSETIRARIDVLDAIKLLNRCKSERQLAALLGVDKKALARTRTGQAPISVLVAMANTLGTRDLNRVCYLGESEPVHREDVPPLGVDAVGGGGEEVRPHARPLIEDERAELLVASEA